MTIYEKIAARIIQEQELLMGPVAWSEAGKVDGLNVKIDKKEVSISKSANAASIVDALVDKFGKMFGRAAKEVCKEAVNALIADLKPSQIPAALK